MVRRRRAQSNDGGRGSEDSDRIIDGNDGKGGDNKVLCSIALRF